MLKLIKQFNNKTPFNTTFLNRNNINEHMLKKKASILLNKN